MYAEVNPLDDQARSVAIRHRSKKKKKKERKKKNVECKKKRANEASASLMSVTESVILRKDLPERI